MEFPKLARLNDPILHRRAQAVAPDAFGQLWFQHELDVLVEAMRYFRGVGIAAPQIGIARQMFACEVDHNTRYPDAPPVPLAIYVNPVLERDAETENVLQEGCLSVPALRADVPRATRIVLKAFDRYGQPVTVKAEGFLARIFQHEWDHLNGHIFLERVRDFGSVVRVRPAV